MHEIQPMIALQCLALLRSGSGWCSATVAGPDSHHGRLLDSYWIHRWEGKFCKICHSPTDVEGSCSVEHSSTVSTGSLFCRTLCGIRFYTRLQGLDSSHDISAFSAGQCNIPATPAVFVSNPRTPSKSSCVDNVAAQLPKRRCYSTQALTALSRLSVWHSNQLSALSTSDGLRYTRR
jgi:hypothetical protein